MMQKAKIIEKAKMMEKVHEEIKRYVIKQENCNLLPNIVDILRWNEVDKSKVDFGYNYGYYLLMDNGTYIYYPKNIWCIKNWTKNKCTVKSD